MVAPPRVAVGKVMRYTSKDELWQGSEDKVILAALDQLCISRTYCIYVENGVKSSQEIAKSSSQVLSVFWRKWHHQTRVSR